MNRMQKEKTAADMRASGNKLADIGKHLGVGPERARQLLKSHKKRAEALGMTLEDEIIRVEPNAARAINCLAASGLTIDHILGYGPKSLFRLKNMGSKTARQIARALQRMGKIEDAERWLSGK